MQTTLTFYFLNYVLVYNSYKNVDCHIITQECNQVDRIINNEEYNEDDIELITRDDKINQEKYCNLTEYDDRDDECVIIENVGIRNDIEDLRQLNSNTIHMQDVILP